jgi:hypothetical protein
MAATNAEGGNPFGSLAAPAWFLRDPDQCPTGKSRFVLLVPAAMIVGLP